MATTLELDPVGPDGVADVDADSCAAEMGSIVRPGVQVWWAASWGLRFLKESLRFSSEEEDLFYGGDVPGAPLIVCGISVIQRLKDGPTSHGGEVIMPFLPVKGGGLHRPLSALPTVATVAGPVGGLERISRERCELWRTGRTLLRLYEYEHVMHCRL